MAERHPGPAWIETVARLGYVARGAVYVVVGGVAVSLGQGQFVGRRGALRTLADQPLGSALVIAGAIGFAGYASWRLIQAWDELRGGWDAADLWRAVFYTVRGSAYGLAAVYAIAILVSAEAGGGSSGPTTWLPPFFLVPIGTVIGGYALFVAYHGLSRSFKDDLRSRDMPRIIERPVDLLGVVGYAARAVALGVTGAATVAAGVGVDPVEDLGLDRALAVLARSGIGGPILTAVGIGLVAFGAYSLLQARYRDVDVP